MTKSPSDRISKVELRQAQPGDYQFAESLYVNSMRFLLTELGAWNERDILSKFKSYFELDEARIIVVDGADVGWWQISEVDHAINLDQVYLIDGFRARGIGSQLIQDLFARAETESKPVLLSVVRNNSAVALYRRLGFRVIDEDGYKLHMRWDPP